ncbi:hypothetical protein ACXVUM_13270 [Williamsia sp. SKLECPSW1]
MLIGARRKLGVDYIKDPRAVSRRLDRERDGLVAAVLLHDVIEASFTGVASGSRLSMVSVWPLT